MGDWKKEVMVFSTSLILDKFVGYMPHTKHDFTSTILDNYEFRVREEVEHELMFKQPIAYGLLVNTRTNRVFAVQRNKKGHGDKRLQGKWSWGIGGHVDPEDASSKNPILAAMVREIKEELEVDGEVVPILVGYVNLRGGVHDVHFGVVYILKTTADKVALKESANVNGSWKTMEELKQMAWDMDVEEWSIACLEPLESYFGTINNS